MQPFNDFIRYVLLHFFVPLYRALLSVVGGQRIALAVRNSATSASRYNPFLSDLDLAAVGVRSAEQAAKLRHFHQFGQRLFPVLGELEIYSADEWMDRRQLEIELGALYVKTRVHRKRKWMMSFLERSRNPLARLRASRGLKKCELEIGGAPELHLSLLLRDLTVKWAIEFPPLPASVRFHLSWLETWVASADEARNGDLILSPPEAVLLAAIFPLRSHHPSIDDAVGAVRSNLGVRNYLRAFCRYEYLTMHACVWGEPEMPDWWWANEPDLRHWISS